MSAVRIIGLKVKDFKRIQVVQVEFDKDDNLIEVGGENGNGKTSLLDSVDQALKPSRRILPASAIRRGARCAEVELDLGEYEVKRSFTPDGTKLELYGKSESVGKGRKFSSPTKRLAELVGQGAIDPAELLEADPRDQRQMLIDLVGLDTSEVDQEITDAREDERLAQQEVDHLQARWQGMPKHDDVPDDPLNIAALVSELERAKDQNAEAAHHEESKRLAEEKVADLSNDIEATKAEIERLQSHMAELSEARNRSQQFLDEWEPKPLADVEPIKEKISEAEETNAKVRENKDRALAEERVAQANVERDRATGKLKEAQERRKRMLAEAEFPVEGLGFDAQTVTLNGVPFREASMAERIRVAVAMSLAQSGELKVLMIRDASVFDKKTLRMIAEEAKRHEAQVFAEIVANKDSDGNYDRDCLLYIEEGRLAQEAKAA